MKSRARRFRVSNPSGEPSHFKGLCWRLNSESGILEGMKNAKRLLDFITPSHYKLTLEPRFDDFTFSGQEVIHFELRNASKELEFHCTDLKILGASLDGIKAIKIDFHPDDESVVFKFDADVAAGKHEMAISYTGPLRDDMHGFYRSSYVRDGETKWMAVTQFEPVAAREAFIVIDEPAAKATFDIELIIDEELAAISNTNVEHETRNKERGTKTVQFATTPKMSPYLLAFLVGEFERKTTTTAEGIEVGVYTTPGKVRQAEFALEVAAKTLSFYTDYFGIAYPLPKLDMIAIPDFAAGAMENWGVVTYRETALLVDAANTALFNKQYVAMVVAHELAHQWFGNLVTMGWWTDLWLNEGFASWVEYLAVDHLYPEWQMWTQFVSDDYLAARELDALANTHPIEVEVHHPAEIEEIFDQISYQKGASVIRMLYHYIGEKAFREGLHNYLDAFSYGNATTNDLWRHLEETAAKPVRRIMGDWTSKPGFPMVTMDDEGNIQQQRFFANPSETKIEKAVWPVPFGLRTDEGQTESILLEEADGRITIPTSDWLKPNPDQTSFFITGYTPDQIELLKDPLIYGKLPVIDRLGLLSDITALAEAGKLSGEQILNVASSLRHESDYAVWNGILGGIGRLMAMADDSLHDKLELFVRWLVHPRLEKLDWEPKPGESHFDTLLRPMLIGVAGRNGNEQVMAESRKRFEAHLRGALIPADLRTAVYRTIAKNGTVNDYESLFDKYKKEELQEEQRRLQTALAAFRDPELISRTLKAALSPDVRSQDSVIVILHVLMNRNGRQMAWQYIQDNWDELVRRYGSGGHLLSRLPGGLDCFATHAQADEVVDFFATHPTPGIERTVRQSVEEIRLQADWFDRDQSKLNAFLDKMKY